LYYQKTINPDIVCKIWNLSTITNCVSSDVGVSIIPLMTALTIRPKGTVFKEIEEKPSRTIVSVSYMDRSKKSVALKYEDTVIREYMKLLSKI